MRRIVITGNQGYVGPVVARRLRARFPAARLIGVDIGLFADCTTSVRIGHPELDGVDEQWRKDIRDVTPEDLEDVDGIVHLAAVSNDPMGHAFEAATHEINHRGTVHVARAAAAAGVRRFVFASSCSVYGSAGNRSCSEESEIAPLTAYAASKAAAERGLAQIARSDFGVTALRFATACGASPRVRLDLVLNDFVATALTAKRIDLLSDGTPWRPLIDVGDMAQAVAWALARPDGGYLALNVGKDDWNFQVKDLAQMVSSVCGDVPISLNRSAAPDPRTYTVDFGRCEANTVLRGRSASLRTTVENLQRSLRRSRHLDANFRRSRFSRMHVLSQLHAHGRVDSALRPRPASIALFHLGGGVA